MRKAGAENLETGIAVASRFFAFMHETLEEMQDLEKLSRVLDQMELSEADTRRNSSRLLRSECARWVDSHGPTRGGVTGGECDGDRKDTGNS